MPTFPSAHASAVGQGAAPAGRAGRWAAGPMQGARRHLNRHSGPSARPRGQCSELSAPRGLGCGVQRKRRSRVLTLTENWGAPEGSGCVPVCPARSFPCVWAAEGAGLSFPTCMVVVSLLILGPQPPACPVDLPKGFGSRVARCATHGHPLRSSPRRQEPQPRPPLSPSPLCGWNRSWPQELHMRTYMCTYMHVHMYPHTQPSRTQSL